MSTRELVQEMQRAARKVTVLQIKLLHQIADDRRARLRSAEILRATAGVLKQRIKGSPSVWQRKMREEWVR